MLFYAFMSPSSDNDLALKASKLRPMDLSTLTSLTRSKVRESRMIQRPGVLLCIVLAAHLTGERSPLVCMGVTVPSAHT